MKRNIGIGRTDVRASYKTNSQIGCATHGVPQHETVNIHASLHSFSLALSLSLSLSTLSVPSRVVTAGAAVALSALVDDAATAGGAGARLKCMTRKSGSMNGVISNSNQCHGRNKRIRGMKNEHMCESMLTQPQPFPTRLVMTTTINCTT